MAKKVFISPLRGINSVPMSFVDFIMLEHRVSNFWAKPIADKMSVNIKEVASMWNLHKFDTETLRLGRTMIETMLLFPVTKTGKKRKRRKKCPNSQQS